MVPRVVPSESLLGWCERILEDLVLLVKNSHGLDGLLVRVVSAELAAAELRFILDMLVRLVYIDVSSWKSLFKKSAPLNKSGRERSAIIIFSQTRPKASMTAQKTPDRHQKVSWVSTTSIGSLR